MSEEQQKAKVVVICGPTGVGKTGFAIKLARRFDGEIVGADSMQVYRFMDIGTAKPSADEKAAVVHHMVDIVDPRDHFDAAEYARQASACLAQLWGKGKLPFVTGGTGLYIKSLLYGLTRAAPADPGVRRELSQELERLGPACLHRRLGKVDAASAQRIHPNDGYRIIRALEVHAITGQPISHHHAGHGFKKSPYHALQIGLTVERDQLYRRIDQRVDMMLEQGFIDEVQSLLAKGYSPTLKSMQSLGYRHMVDFIQGRLDRQEAVQRMKRDHRRYAKRQLTWFGADPRVQWLAPQEIDVAVERITHFLKGGSRHDHT